MIESKTTTQISSEAQELIERAKALRPPLQKNAAQTENERRIPEETIEALTQAGTLAAHGASALWWLRNLFPYLP